MESQSQVDEPVEVENPGASAEGVTKTDAQLRQDVTDELARDLSINASHIVVQVEHGIVTLAGRVNSNAERSGAGRAALRVSGVKDLALELDVERPGSGRHHDADIARAVEDLFLLRRLLPKGCIKIKVEGGWLTLSGEVEWDYQKSAVLDALKGISGITGTTDLVTVRSTVSAKVVKFKIEGR